MMGKIDSAKEILIAFGLPEKQQNDRSARTLIALANLKRNSSWNQAESKPMTIHEIIEFIKQYYKFVYAENSRETIRRQTIHQFEQAGIVIRNIDDPYRPTNSPLTNYSLSQESLEVIKSYKSQDWEDKVSEYLEKIGTLTDKYHKKRKALHIPISIKNKDFTLSPGKHNELQVKIKEKFVPLFAPGAVLLYMGDTSLKHLFIDTKNIKKLNIDITQHGKLPDIVLYLEERDWLYLIEAVTSHGPVSHTRVVQLQELLKNNTSHKIYISAFPDFKTFLKYAKDIAWDTDIWIAERPEHMIHYNGNKFLKPL
jgi:adenine-specific DNA-methyltransferase